MEFACLPGERATLSSVWVPLNVIATIQSAIVPSARLVYDMKWFLKSGATKAVAGIVPFQCSIADMLTVP